MKQRHPLDPGGLHASMQASVQQCNDKFGGLSTNKPTALASNRGRPRQRTEYLSLDPTTDFYLQAEGRAGAGMCPLEGVDDIVEDLFPVFGKFPDVRSHPLTISLMKYANVVTPGNPPNNEIEKMDPQLKI